MLRLTDIFSIQTRILPISELYICKYEIRLHKELIVKERAREEKFTLQVLNVVFSNLNK